MAAQVYKSRDGDVVDAVAWRYYGRVDAGVLRAVLEANPGLADYGDALPAGVRITLPDLPPAATVSQGVSLWD